MTLQHFLPVVGCLVVVPQWYAYAQEPGFLETFNGKSKGMLVAEGWDFFPNSGFSISAQQPFDLEHIRGNAGEGNPEYMATPCIEFDTDLDTVTFYYRSFGFTYGYFTIGYQDAFDPLGVNVLWMDSIPLTNVWTLKTAIYDPPDTPEIVRLVFGLTTVGSGSGGKLGIDHITSKQAMTSYNCDQILPINLLSFSGKPMNQGVELEWSSVEVNTSEYVIERAGVAGVFEPIGSVVATAMSVQPVDYDFTDHSPEGRLAYYRLQAVDHDGSREFSEIIVINTESASAMRVYPNPLVGSELFIIPGSGSDQYEVRLYDMVGSLVHSEILPNNEPPIRVEVPERLHDVMFVVELCGSGNCESQRILASNAW